MPAHLISTLALCSCLLPVASAGAPATASFYIEQFGLITSQSNSDAARAHQIFQKLVRVIDQINQRSPRLAIVNTRGRPWAIALPDGHVILTRGALDLCFRTADARLGDARMAFVLGHELAHLANDDFWHRDVFLSLAGSSASQSLVGVQRSLAVEAGSSGDEREFQEAFRNKELAADDRGFLYASLAGYETDRLVREQDFFRFWVEQTGTVADPLHHDPAIRSDFLRARLAKLGDILHLFEFSVRLTYFGKYDQALRLLTEFQRHFPSREVFNNLGFLHLQLARRHMPFAQAHRYWMPLLVDTETRLKTITRALTASAEDQRRIDSHLREAIRVLSLAVESDAQHIPSRINLASAYFLQKEFHKARAAIEEARTLDPGNEHILGLRALILANQEEDADLWPAARRDLMELARLDHAPPSIVFNTARALDERGEAPLADRYWSRLALLTTQLPTSFRSAVCLRNGGSDCARTATVQDYSPPLQPGIGIGTDIEEPQTRRILRDWWEISGLTMSGVLVYEHHDQRALALDSRIEMVAVTPTKPLETADLLRCCGRPTNRIRMRWGNLWAYSNSWSALIEEDQVREVWFTRGL